MRPASLLRALCGALLFLGLCACGPVQAPADGAVADLGTSCRSVVDCDDGVFCNGTEQCVPGMPGADARGCRPAPAGPCPQSLTCDEAARLCRLGDAGADALQRCDQDGDGENGPQCGGMDCDDNDPDRFHGNHERCNGTLRDGRPAAPHDEDCNPCTVFDPATALDGDLDADRFASASCSNPWVGAAAPTGCDPALVRADTTGGHAQVGADCNDSSRSVNPNAPEVCANGLDDNCDGQVDESGMITVYADADGDGQGSSSTAAGTSRSASACMIPAGFVANNTDCDDARAQTHRGAQEQCDGLDNDCSLAGALAGGPDPAEDADGDLHSPPGARCLGAGEVGALFGAFPKDDCDDNDLAVHPGVSLSEELGSCNNTDNDCDPSTTELTAACSPQGVCVQGGVCDRAQAVQQLAVGGYHSCVRYADGTARCWGSNANGQLGVGVAGAPAAPTLVQGLSNAVELAAGENHTCARINDGTVLCWGANNSGQLGNGDAMRRDRAVPVPVLGLRGVVGLSAGLSHTCAVLSDGSVRCWGGNGSNQLGDGTTTPRLVPTRVVGLPRGVVQVAAGSNHTLARMANGTVQAWGQNSLGQLGDGTMDSPRVSPVAAVGLSRASSIAAHGQLSCAVLQDGTAACWGLNTFGQVGDGTVSPQRVAPTPVLSLANIVSLDVGSSFACAALADGTVSCWGSNASGVVQPGATASSASPRQVAGLSSVVQVGAGALHACARTADGQLLCWGGNASTYGQLGGVTTANPSAPVALPAVLSAQSLGAGAQFFCVVRGDGQVYCWGANTNGQLGDGTTTNRFLPSPVRLGALAAGFSAGQQFACVVLADGTVSCWGNNSGGQLCDGTVVPHFLPAPALDNDGMGTIQPLSHVLQARFGNNHGCARLDASAGQRIRCWGSSNFGQLGDGGPLGGVLTSPSTVVYAGTGTLAPLSNATDLAAGYSHSCAVHDGGLVHCWGSNTYLQLGDPATTAQYRSAAVPVAGVSGAVQVAAGQFHSCARLAPGGAASGPVWCWGRNNHGQLGDSTLVDRGRAAPVSGVTDAVFLAAGQFHTCAVLSDRTVACWGAGADGALGNNGTTDASSPTQVLVATAGGMAPLRGVTQVAAGQAATCAVRSDGAVFCWGAGPGGQLGTGVSMSALVAVPLLSL